MSKKIVTGFPYAYDVVENDWIPLSDGCRLSARMWFPKTSQPVPAIMEYIPYRKRDGMRGRDEPMHGYFAGHGYAVIRVDMRGSGESDGFLEDEYLKQEQDDAVECINWIASQPWCNGRVGMMGKSWGGFNSLQVAARRPKPLKAIITVGFVDDRYTKDIHYKGGCLLNDNFWWGSIMFGYQSRPLDPEIVGPSWKKRWLERLDRMPDWMGLWMDHPLRDDYWKHGSICENYGDIQIPVFALDGWADSYTNSVLSLMAGLNVPRKAMIGPWAHVFPHDGAPGPAIGFLQEAIRWWDKWLKGVDNDVMDDPMIQVWIEDSMKPEAVHPVSRGRWVGLDGWPSGDVRKPVYSLTYGKLLSSGSGREETVFLHTPQNHGLLAGEWMGAGVPGESPCDQRIDDGMAMIFDSDPLAEDFEILGDPEFEIMLASDKPKAMLYAEICDLDPEGDATRVSYGVMNLTHLQGHDRVVLLKPGEFVKAKVTLDTCGHRFLKGHRVRLALATTFWPMFWNMPEDAVLTLKLDTAKLSLPEFHGKTVPGPNPCPESAPLTPTSVLSPGRVDRSITYDVLTDTWTCITDGVGGVFGEGIYQFDEIDVTVEHNLKRLLTLSNKDPLSAKYTIIQNMRLGRQGWMTDSKIVSTLTADISHFYIKVEMDSTLNDEPVFHKVWKYTTERVGL